MTKLLNYPINDIFYNLVMDSKKHIKLCAPYVKDSIVKEIYEIKRKEVPLEIISSFNIGNFYRKSSDVEAFKYILENNDKVYNSQLLHAKLYIFDDKYTIVTSANLTISGFKRNLEYGVLIEDRKLVNQTIYDYHKICNNPNTGEIKVNKIFEIQKLLRNLPEYRNVNIPSLSDEIDSILDIDINILGANVSPWKRLALKVIEQINKEEFSLVDIYAFEETFQREYPDNNTIRDSIRRNLQELRDMGLIKFLGDGRYLKLWKNR